jgi:hydroxypyruvate reductase
MHTAPGSRQRDLLISVFQGALDAVRADTLFERASGVMELRRASRGTDHIAVVGAGKAGIPMALCAEDGLDGEVDAGLVVVPTGYTTSLPPRLLLPSRVTVVESEHPIPGEAGAAAGARILDLVRGYGSGDLVVVLISGGASALLPTPVPGISLEEMTQTTNVLLRSGATIQEVNTVRKHVSAIGGGRLAQAAYPARVINYIVSDVIGDDPSFIGSGPCVPDETTFRNARDVVSAYDLWPSLPDSVVTHLRSGAPGGATDTPDSDTEYFEFVSVRMLGTNADALDGAAKAATACGLQPTIVRSDLSGEAREAGAMIARTIAEAAPGTCLIWGGETTVTVQGNGRGGRNQELALAAGLELERLGSDAAILSVGTDGIDGLTQAAGAWVDGTSMESARSIGLDPEASLADNASGTFFETLKQQVVTGPTHRNVMDVVVANR